MSAPEEGEGSMNPQSFEPKAPKGTAPRKKVYVRPELRDWGSIADLTQGGKAGLEDFPQHASGTRVV